MNRDKIETKYKWRTTDLFESNEDFVNSCERLKISLRKLAGFRGKLNVEEKILKFFELQEEIERKLEKIIVYAYTQKSVIGADPTSVLNFNLAQDLSVEAGVASSFASEELSKLGNDQLRAMAKKAEFAPYARDIDFIIRNKPHVLNDETEKLLSGMGAFTDFEALFQSLSDIEMPIADLVLKTGKHVKLSNSNYSKFMHSADRDLRKQAYTKLYDAYKKLNLTYSNNYINQLKYSNFLSKTYNFKSNFERVCFYEEVDPKVVSIMLESVHEALPLLQKLQNLKKKALKLPNFELFDIFAPLNDENEPKIYYNKAVKIITESLSPMGEDYITLINHALKDRWVDLYPCAQKDSCSYCISCFDAHPLVLTNFCNTSESVSTLSHELGHAMQSYLESKTQPFSVYESPSLTCEIASTVNEVLTKKYMIDNATDKSQKINAIDDLLSEFYGAIFKQSLYTEFELFVFGEIEKGEGLNFDILNNKYKEILREYFSESMTLSAGCEVEWSRLPHLFSPFYVYKYVVGFVSAITICGKLLSGQKEYAQTYLDFLSAGNSKPPKELLKMAGIDLMDKNTYTQAFNIFKLYIDELEELIGE